MRYTLCDQTLQPTTSFGTATGQSFQQLIQSIRHTYFDAVVAGHEGQARDAHRERDWSYAGETDLAVEEKDGDSDFHRGGKEIVNPLQ